MSTQLKKGVLEMVVLGMIDSKDSYGYDIYQGISKYMEISESTIYPILRKLTKDGLCETYLRESSEGPPRKYFRISLRGRKTFQTLKEEWVEFVDVVNEMIRGEMYE